MRVRSLYLGLPLATLALALMACTDDAPIVSGIPPCTPVEGSDIDPCDPTREARVPGEVGDRPKSIRSYLEESGRRRVVHMVIRATYLPGTVRCVVYEARWWSLGGEMQPALACFVDVRVNQYIVGEGPARLALAYASFASLAGIPDPAVLESAARSWERVISNGGLTGQLEVEPGGIVGNENIMFIGPARNHDFEVMSAYSRWDVQRRGDNIVAIHPHAETWLWVNPNRYRNLVELPLYEVVVQARKASDDRIRERSFYPRIVANVNRLHDYYVEAGFHPSGPPLLPPPACGLVVPDYLNNPGLMQDCMVLLEAKDALRGTGR